VIPAAQIGAGVPDFGFAHDYILNQSPAQRVGSGGVQPLAAFVPLNGVHSEGAYEIAFAPRSFPGGLNNGVFVGFFGQSTYGVANGLVNTQNPVVYYDLGGHKYFHFISNDEPALGHPIGLLATSDSVFLSDIAPTNDFNTPSAGTVYQITVVPRATPQTFSITGIVFNDANRNGRLDGREAGLGRDSVFLDSNNDGIFERGEPVAGTDRRGGFTFSGLAAGTYHVGSIAPRRWVHTTPAVVTVTVSRRSPRGISFGVAAAVARRGR
jgi:hypothetical protein